MKVIDLLNKIAKGENFENCKMKFNVGEPELVNEYVIYDRLYEEDFTLNDKVEIIEEEKEIEEFKTNYTCSELDLEIIDKINELVRELNKIKKEGM